MAQMTKQSPASERNAGRLIQLRHLLFARFWQKEKKYGDACEWWMAAVSDTTSKRLACTVHRSY
jgi:hypothetical protein